MKFQWWHAALMLALGLAMLSPIASSSPDGLERVAEDKGFVGKAIDASYQLIPDYVMPGVANEAVATIIAGILGTLILFIIGYGLTKLLKAKSEA